ncbi:uncharacterized protein CC84DRAFT_1163635 [Paraphaeosphaeria sporulosa]|uniref:Secreted protein n=1 Tax=Paraphaeosphaeria sporulosa TaxID=1460663 RepID=A0A177CJR6_9PLEO|nr:uncharacterized protein CC84DRAFT_1163635 [Paraphaeosphaeria sporulosa]OAG07491.1 hypothetical protein CC84DRAFT_1163635 [Paraphaeosphaeria sporulosa]
MVFPKRLFFGSGFPLLVSAFCCHVVFVASTCRKTSPHSKHGQNTYSTRRSYGMWVSLLRATADLMESLPRVHFACSTVSSLATAHSAVRPH